MLTNFMSEEPYARVVLGNRWLQYDPEIEEWVVYEKLTKKKATLIIRTSDVCDAIEKLTGSEF